MLPGLKSRKRNRRLSRRTLISQQLESRQLLAGDLQNPEFRFDVNADQRVSPIDALLVINELSRRLLFRNAEPTPDRFFDVSGDGRLSPLDALQVINVLVRDRVGPEIEVDLANDSGVDGDQITNDPLFAGRVSDESGVIELFVQRDDQSLEPIDFDRSTGEFVFDPGLLQEGTDDGTHRFQFLATDAQHQSSSPIEIVVQLDTQAEVPQIDLDPEFDDGVQGDQITTQSRVRLLGLTEPGSTIRVDLDAQTKTVTADQDGEFAIDQLSLPGGIREAVITSRDVAGNESQSTATLIRSVTPEAFKIAESDDQTVEESRLVQLGPVGTPRQISFTLQSLLDRSDPSLA
ncbi:MAG: Ig-like domain-containing protein, partial [Planctomycetota bacterium]